MENNEKNNNTDKNHTTNIINPQFEESVLFSDFKVCKDIGSGAFGKIYLVNININNFFKF